jgi:glycosyltransferase involved in cell wall biosynthesis
MDPKTAYILLWFPKASETFIFREVTDLIKMGLPLQIFTLYGELPRDQSQEMRSYPHHVERLGVAFLKKAHGGMIYWFRRDRHTMRSLLRELSFASFRGLEKSAENLWAFVCAFHLARRFEGEGIEHIHAPWASGAATAAWIASRLTNIPFSFTARAWDIYPPDGLLRRKISEAALVRCETQYNIRHLAKYADGNLEKIHLTYNGVPLSVTEKAPVFMQPPYRILALGRFVGKKGYEYLLHACKILRDEGLEFRLTLAGDGPRRARLKHLTRKLELVDWVSFPGFIHHDRVPDHLNRADIFLMPSVVHASGDRDGIPTVLMESLLHRVPVIATDVSGIPELIEEGVTGLVVRERDPSAIARAVKRLVVDRESALALAERGRVRVTRKFDPVRNHLKVLELYRERIKDIPRHEVP